MNILIVRVSAIGDVVHTLPSIFLLKQAMPDAKIHWLVQTKAASLIQNQFFLKQVWELPDKFFAPKNVISTIKTIQALKKIQWDAIIDFQGLLKTSLLLMSLKGTKFGFDAHNARWKQSTWFTHHRTTPVFKNIVQKNLALATDVITHLTHVTKLPTINALEPLFNLTFPPEVHDAVNTWITTHNASNIIALCPNTTWPSKHWPTEHWKELCTLLLQQHPEATLVLIGKYHGAAAQAVDAYAQKNNAALLSLPSWNLLTTAYFLTKIKLLLAPDTGILYIADFLGVQSLGIFGPTSKEKHGPWLRNYNQRHAVQIACPHVYEKTHGQQNHCMSTLTPSMLGAKIKAILVNQ